MKRFFEKHNSEIFFVIALLIASFLYNYHQILSSRPSIIHQWRQADCLSITMNYYKENLGFFEPAIHWVGAGDGKTVSEFPIIYFTVAQLWKIFGYHEFIFRLVNLLIVFSGLFCMFKLLKKLLSGTFWAIAVTLFLFTSPILVYYSNNFTADAPAFGFALIGCYFYCKSLFSNKKKWFYISFIFFLLAGLVKITALMIFVAFFAIHIYIIVFQRKEKTWYRSASNLLPYFLVIALVFVWYSYAKYYNSHHVGGIFLQGILPIWDIDKEARKQIWMSFRKQLLPAYFNIKALYFVLSVFLCQFLFYRKINKFLFYTNILVFLGSIIYIILFYKVFNVHDYYLTNLLIFIPLPVIALLEMINREYPIYLNKVVFKATVVIAIGFLALNTSILTRMKYNTEDFLVRHNFIVSTDQINQLKYYHTYYSDHIKAFETITPYLRNIGLKRTDRVLSLSDGSPNITLYLMDQKGFTDFGYGDLTFSDRIEFFKNHGVKYLVIDSTLHNQNYLKPYIVKKIGSYKNIEIFKLK